MKTEAKIGAPAVGRPEGLAETPETDQAVSIVWIKCEDSCCEVWAEKSGNTIDVVDADFARKLERKLNALRNAIRFAAARFERISWGYDGDCGSRDAFKTLENLLPENAPTEPRHE